MTIYDNVKFPLTNLRVKTSLKAKKIIDNNTIIDLLENHIAEIETLLDESVYNGKISKENFARKMVFRFHIVTSLALRIYRFGLQGLKGEELSNRVEEIVSSLKTDNEKEKAKIEKKGCSLNEKNEILNKDGVTTPSLVNSTI